jgi:hypothetical protein
MTPTSSSFGWLVGGAAPLDGAALVPVAVAVRSRAAASRPVTASARTRCWLAPAALAQLTVIVEPLGRGPASR